MSWTALRQGRRARLLRARARHARRRGDRSDPAAAKADFEKGCKLNEPAACFELARAIEADPAGGDKKQTAALYGKACEAKFFPACTSRGLIEAREGRREAALSLYRRACDNFEAAGCWELATALPPSGREGNHGRLDQGLRCWSRAMLLETREALLEGRDSGGRAEGGPLCGPRLPEGAGRGLSRLGAQALGAEGLVRIVRSVRKSLLGGRPGGVRPPRRAIRRRPRSEAGPGSGFRALGASLRGRGEDGLRTGEEPAALEGSDRFESRRSSRV